MKNSILLLVLFFVSLTISAQDGAYQQAMGKAMGEFGQAKTPEGFKSASNSFARIAENNQGQCLPDYYAALSMITQTFYMKDAAERDALVDKAIKHIEAAEELSPNNDELEVLRGFALTAKMVVDPSTRGQKYSPMIAMHYGKAMQMDPENPRAAAMMARNELGTAQFFGSETTKACDLAQKSIALFENEKAEGFSPSWGKDTAMEVVAACK